MHLRAPGIPITRIDVAFIPVWLLGPNETEFTHGRCGIWDVFENNILVVFPLSGG